MEMDELLGLLWYLFSFVSPFFVGDILSLMMRWVALFSIKIILFLILKKTGLGLKSAFFIAYIAGASVAVYLAYVKLI